MNAPAAAGDQLPITSTMSPTITGTLQATDGPGVPALKNAIVLLTRTAKLAVSPACCALSGNSNCTMLKLVCATKL